jgi:hypothetical protein
MSYSFRTTYRQDEDTYVEDRGYAHAVKRGDADFATLDKEFGSILSVGQTATRNSDGDGWAVEDGSPLLAIGKEKMLETLREAWLAAEACGTVSTSAGFVIDATERANRDIEGLITSMEASGTENVTFCAADNSFHPVTLEQLKAMRLEIISHGQALYARKWELRTAIEQATTFEALDAVTISFEGV